MINKHTKKEQKISKKIQKITNFSAFKKFSFLSSGKVKIISLPVPSHHRTCRSAYGGSLNTNSF
jgi:hypothetical protein